MKHVVFIALALLGILVADSVAEARCGRFGRLRGRRHHRHVACQSCPVPAPAAAPAPKPRKKSRAELGLPPGIEERDAAEATAEKIAAPPEVNSLK